MSSNINVTYTVDTITVNEIDWTVTVSETTNEITVGESTATSVNDIRAALSNVSPILYNASTGVFSLDSNATFSGKTTDNLTEGSTNLYFTAARARSNISVTDQGGDGSLTYSSSTGVITYTGPNQSEANSRISAAPTQVRSHFSATSPISITNGVIAIDANALFSGKTTDNLTEGSVNKYFSNTLARAAFSGGQGINYNSSTGVIALGQFYENVVNNGNVSANVTFNLSTGTIHQAQLVGNITGISFSNLVAGSTVTMILKQDAIGFRLLDTTTFASNWTNWEFVGDFKTLNTNPNATDILSVVYDGTKYWASLVAFDATTIQNNQLANSNITVNGVTIALGSSGNIDTFNSNVTVNGNLNVTGNLNYQNVTDLYVTDQKITLNSNAATNANVEIISNRPTATNTMLKWNEPSTRWEFTNNGTTYYPIPASTTDLAEGTNLYYTTARVRGNVSATSATGISYDSGTGVFSLANIPNSSLTNSTITINGKIVALGGSNTLTTSDISEGTNLYFTAARVRGNISAAENITYNSSTGVIGLANSLANVNSVSTESGQNLTLNTNTSVVLTESIKSVTTNVGNISGDGYGFIQGLTGGISPPTTCVFTHSGTGELNSYRVLTGNTTANSNVMTGVTIAEVTGVGVGAGASLSNVLPYYAPSLGLGATIQYPFPAGTYVTSVDAANGTITFNNNAASTANFTGDVLTLTPGAYDNSTGLLLGLISTYTGTGSGSKTTLLGQSLYVQGAYGYPATGPTPNSFVFAVDTASDYGVGSIDTNKLFARTKIEAPRTVFHAPRGIVVGNGDLTGRAEGDPFPTFGINILWDGLANTTTEYGGSSTSGPGTQLLLKQYSDNSSAQGTNGDRNGPRILFTAARGNKNQSYSVTYPRVNNELGRITWWGPTEFNQNPSTTAPPAYINAMVLQDYFNHNGGTGLYFAASPHTDAARRGQFLAHHLGNTVIASSSNTNTGATQPITFAPMATALTNNTTNLNTSSNSIALYNNTMAANNYQWAYINYNDPAAKTGSKLTVTNGVSTVAGRNGNIVIALDRNDNGAGFGNKEWALKLQPSNTSLVLTEDDVIRTTFASGGNVDITGNINLTGRLLGYDQVYGEFCYTAGNIVPAAPDTIYAFPLDTTNMSSDVVANNTSRINIVKPGRFKLITSIQVKNADNANDHLMRFWLRKNGTDVANSATLITPLKLQEQVVAMDWMVESDGDDYFEIVYYVNDTDVTFPYYAAGTTPVTYPAAPPIIVNVIPIGA